MELYVSNPVNEFFAVMDEAAEYATRKGLTSHYSSIHIEVLPPDSSLPPANCLNQDSSDLRDKL